MALSIHSEQHYQHLVFSLSFWGKAYHLADLNHGARALFSVDETGQRVNSVSLWEIFDFFVCSAPVWACLLSFFARPKIVHSHFLWSFVCHLLPLPIYHLYMRGNTCESRKARRIEQSCNRAQMGGCDSIECCTRHRQGAICPVSWSYLSRFFFSLPHIESTRKRGNFAFVVFEVVSPST